MAATPPKKSQNPKKPETLQGLGEFGFIDKLRESLKAKNPSVVLGPGDDAAIFKPTPGHELVFTTDMLVEGRHFDFKWITPWQLGAKTMAVNVSDCAAMGAKPTVAVVSLGVPKDYPVKDLEAFYDGMKSWGESFGAQIVGGDTVGSEKFVVNIALIGEVENGRALRRSGAKAGDALFVTGTVGDSAAGLSALQQPGLKGHEAASLLIKKHLTPVPRFNVGRYLGTKKLASAAIDISDGLSSEIHHLCEESGLGAEIHEEALPLSPSLIQFCQENQLQPLDFALNGGEDYELLFTIGEKDFSKLYSLEGNVRAIGRMKKGMPNVVVRKIDGKTDEYNDFLSYQHFITDNR